MRAPRSKRQSKPRRNKGRKFRQARDVPEWASLSCKRSMAPTAPPGATAYNANQMYNLMDTQLVQFERATLVAQGYQHYRIKKITLTFKPTFDNYLASAGAVTKPNLYYMIDKSGAIATNVTLEGLKQMGAKPIQLDEKNLKVSWRPSVLESVMYSGGGAGLSASSKYKVSPWLTTTSQNVSPAPVPASGIDHLGIYWYVDQLANPVGAQYTVEVECQFEFKKPQSTGLTGAVEAIASRPAILNDSPDGIVGGGDGV